MKNLGLGLFLMLAGTPMALGSLPFPGDLFPGTLMSFSKQASESVECLNPNHFPEFGRFHVYGNTGGKAIAPGIYNIEFKDSLQNLRRGYGFLVRVEVSSWTCPPDGDSTEQFGYQYYLALYDVLPATGFETRLGFSGKYFSYDPVNFSVNVSTTYTREQILDWNRYVDLIGDNIGVSVSATENPFEVSTVIGTLGPQKTLFQAGCVNSQALERTGAVVTGYHFEGVEKTEPGLGSTQ